tara:strand:+ start:7402 stop:7626 length:225 start_codon:yes stop_codon:yes gene_type:complete
MNDNGFKFSDDVIAQVAKLIQVAILTGTDIVDHLRQVRLKLTGDTLYVDDDYASSFEDNIQSMLKELEENATGE